MSKTLEESKHKLPDVASFIETVKLSEEFSAKSEIYITRAPGRLDVMGGIADYSGSLVLEMPIAEAALVALQPRDERRLRIKSLGAEENNRTHIFEMPLDEFTKNGAPLAYAEAEAKFKSDPANHWAAYVAGAFLVVMRELNYEFTRGATILIDSKVPEGKGVSSSAAIEVAVMSAVAAAFKLEIDARELAILCQKLENLVVGAPCGIMDQMSSACGAENQLLSMICQPAELKETIRIPENLAVWGIDSGIRHSVGAGDYGSVRTGAFMGYRIIAELAGLRVEPAEIDGVAAIADGRWNGYLANISPEEFEREFAAQLPQSISGATFLEKYQGISDTVARISPEKTYAVYAPTAHPVYENFRVHKFVELLDKPFSEAVSNQLGNLMYESHKSYTACGLGADGTDLLVELVRQSNNLYGAKITGGGSGGTVAVLGRRGADADIKKIAEDYALKTGYQPYIFSGSSTGAATFGCLKIYL